MTQQRLIVYIDETWPQEPSAPWVLLDDRDKVLEKGESEPKHWPGAQSFEVMLSATQTNWLDATLPRGAQRHQDRLLRFALEEQLLRETDEQHLVITRRQNIDSGILVNVLVVARRRIQQLIAQFEAIGRKPAHIAAELQTIPQSADPEKTWTLVIGPQKDLVLRYGREQALAVDAVFLSDILSHLLLQARTRNQEPESIEIRASSPAARPSDTDLKELQRAIGLPCQRTSDYLWWQSTRQATDLLQGEFSSKGARGGRALARLKGPLWLAGSAWAIWCLVTAGTVIWQHNAISTIDTRMFRLFETAVPNTPAVMPAAQLARALNDARAQHGMLRNDDFLALLNAYSEIRDTTSRHSITALNYQGGTLQLELQPLPPQEATRLESRFAALGYHFTVAGNKANLYTGVSQ